ncbi:restriction endonuclease [Paenibacillus sp. IHB B 3415]|uniref:restriction endonuclease n=1 Tax=Paenibacillus sp. IHB B 3415 TaxID=867080 RepID=UPI00062E4F74|nr:restriction endonuclease [Paenibacillus sp. IHB B 3415]
MARRKSKAKQEEEFFEALAGLAALSMAGLGFLITKSIYGGVVGVILGLTAVISIMRYISNKRAERLRKSGIAEIDKMDGVQFEQYLGHLFRSQGYKAEVTQAAGDYGADLVLSKDGKRIVVQAKRYSKNVGLKAVQEVRGAVSHYGASAAWVVTNRDYTEQAYKLAKSNNVRLIGREELIEMLLQMREKMATAKKANNAKTSA